MAKRRQKKADAPNDAPAVRDASDADERGQRVRREKPERTPEDLAAIAYLDRLRSGEGETAFSNPPLACIVRVIAYEEIPKANERYALATLRGPDGREWKMSILRYFLEEGMNALFVSKDAAMPDEERYRNRDVARTKVRVYKFGFGVKARRLLPIVNRSIYLFNCGLLYPLDDFPELSKLKPGQMCATRLGIDSAADLRDRAAPGRRGTGI